MKKSRTNEENMFQKYDDLFAEQDKKYDTNNTNRYAKKKSVRSEDVEYQRYESKKDISKDNNKSSIIVAVTIFFIFGIAFFVLNDLELLKDVPPFVIIGFVVVISSLFRKNKRKK